WHHWLLRNQGSGRIEFSAKRTVLHATDIGLLELCKRTPARYKIEAEVRHIAASNSSAGIGIFFSYGDQDIGNKPVYRIAHTFWNDLFDKSDEDPDWRNVCFMRLTCCEAGDARPAIFNVGDRSFQPPIITPAITEPLSDDYRRVGLIVHR